MELSIFLAKVLGIYLFLVSAAMFSRRATFTNIIREVSATHGVLLLGTIMALVAGILLVVSHNVWVMDWPIVITLLSWLILLNAIARLFFPEVSVAIAHSMQRKSVYLLSGGISFLLALFLLCKGFYPG